MTIVDLINLTGQLPNRGTTTKGLQFVVDVSRNGRLGYIARMWEVQGLDVKERVLEYGTGTTPEQAKESLKNKLINPLISEP